MKIRWRMKGAEDPFTTAVTSDSRRERQTLVAYFTGGHLLVTRLVNSNHFFMKITTITFL